MDQSKIISKLKQAGLSGDSQARQFQTAAHVEVPERPQLAPGVQLAGQMPDTGFTEQQWLVVRNGKFIQVSELLYRVAELADGRNTLERIAEVMTETTEWMVTPDHVRQLVKKLIPLGVIAPAGDREGTAMSPERVEAQPADRPALGFDMRAKVIGPQFIDPIARVLEVLYTPPILIAVLIGVAIAHLWFYFVHGASASFLDLLYRPWALPVVLLLMVLAGLFHEFGHAAALRYGGGQVRGMGVGIYLLYPAFYTDVTDSYRLGRWSRVRIDLGGFYFYLIFTLAIFGLFLWTGQEFLLFAVILINLDILYQSIPLVRLDGYWALADLTGVPDFLSMLGPFLASILSIPGWKGARLPKLKPWVKVVFAAYTLLALPLLLFGVVFMVLRLPRYLATLWDSILYQTRVFSLALSNGDVPGMIVLAFSMLILSVMISGSLYLFFRIARSLAKGLWNWSKPTPKRRIGGSMLALGVLGLIGYFWAPYLYLFTHTPPVGVRTFEIASRDHVEGDVSYAQNPPVGGDHAPVWQNCGYYDAPIAPEFAVHSMEHGAVWITYRPDLPTNQVTALRQMAYRQIYVIASPNPDQSSPLVASAWGRQLNPGSIRDPRLDQFIRAFRLGEQAPESGEPCTGGMGEPR